MFHTRKQENLEAFSISLEGKDCRSLRLAGCTKDLSNTVQLPGRKRSLASEKPSVMGGWHQTLADHGIGDHPPAYASITLSFPSSQEKSVVFMPPCGSSSGN